MRKYQLTEDVAQDQKYWMTKMMASPTHGKKSVNNYIKIVT